MYLFSVSKTFATMATFLVSGIIHEVLFFVAFKGTNSVPWFFIGMVTQGMLRYTSLPPP